MGNWIVDDAYVLRLVSFVFRSTIASVLFLTAFSFIYTKDPPFQDSELTIDLWE